MKATAALITFGVLFSAVITAADPPVVRSELKIDGRVAHLQVTDPRPLAEAVFRVGRELHIRVGFEEAPLVYKKDLVDVTSPTYVPKSGADRASIARGGDFNVDFNLPENGAPAATYAVLERIVDMYNKSAYPGTYAIRSEPGNYPLFFVYPVQAANARGSTAEVKALGLVRLSLSNPPRSLFEQLNEAFHQIGSATGARVSFGGPTYENWFGRPALAKLPPDIEACAFLNLVAVAASAPFWQLLWWPSGGEYFLSFRR